MEKEVKVRILSRAWLDVYKKLNAGETLRPFTSYSRSSYVNRVGQFLNSNGGLVSLHTRNSICWRMPEWIEWDNDRPCGALSGYWVKLKDGYKLVIG